MQRSASKEVRFREIPALWTETCEFQTLVLKTLESVFSILLNVQGLDM